MKTFDFVAFDPSGKKRAGALKARSLSEAKRKLQKGGLFLVSIEIQTGQNPYSRSSPSFFRQLKEILFS